VSFDARVAAISILADASTEEESDSIAVGVDCAAVDSPATSSETESGWPAAACEEIWAGCSFAGPEEWAAIVDCNVGDFSAESVGAGFVGAEFIDTGFVDAGLRDPLFPAICSVLTGVIESDDRLLLA
jgi:hypothetical protein